MQLNRCAQGVCGIGLLLISCGLILDDLAIIFAAGTLIAALLGQFILFDNDVRKIVTSVTCERVLSRNTVRTGTSVQVTTRFTFRGVPHMQVQITDMIPPNTTLIEGKTTISADPSSRDQTHQCRYQIIPLIHGELFFSGISVTLRNLFFEETILLTRTGDRNPALTVMPTGFFAMPASESYEGSSEGRRASLRSSIDIHSLREYMAGDDLRHVDWKTSAKHDKLYVRKYTGVLSYPPLIIVDLPWIGAPVPEKAFNRMISEVTGMVKHSLQTYQYVSVLFISGPNLRYLIREERNVTRCLTELRDWLHPTDRAVHFFHMSDRSDLRSSVRSLETASLQTTDVQNQDYFRRLMARYHETMKHQKNPAFSGQIARAVAQIQVTEAYLFSLGIGDTSHIRHVERPLRTQKIRVHIRIIDSPPSEPATKEGTA